MAATQKFCHECGAGLSPASDDTPDEETPTEPFAPPAATDAAATTTELDAPTTPVEGGAALEPTTPIDVDDGTLEWDDPTVDAAVDTAVEPTVVDAADDTTEPTPVATVDTTTVDTTTVDARDESAAVTTVAAVTAPIGADATEELPGTVEERGLFDGHDDLAAFPEPREPFQIRLSFVLALFGLGAMLMSVVADVIDLRTTRPVAGITTGAQTLDDIGSNLAVAGFVGAAAMVLGGLLACFGLRWGAGVAGGAGLAVAGWAGLTIGLAEFPIAVAESITRTSTEAFTLRVTRDLGWWLIAGVGVVGVLVFLASLRSIGTGRRTPLNPLVAAVTAVAAAVLAFGPLVPVGDAVFADNFRSVDPNRDLPTAFFAGRLGQVALIAVAGVIGMLMVRNYGVGLAAGGLTVATWMWASSLAELGDRPIGIADRNPGAASTVPHAVTTTGMVSALTLLALATILAVIRSRRQPTA